MKNPVIEATDLHKRYGAKIAVDNVSFTVNSGEIFGILGPNGAGKTTTVECISGPRRPDGGTISVLGKQPRDKDLRESLGVQLQESTLQSHLSVSEVLDLYASFYPDPADWNALLDQLGLTAQRNVRFGKLSGGQKQRLSIALALVGNPRIAILDELTTGLDPQARRDTRVAATPVDVVLTDLRMPRMGGVEAIQALATQAPEVRVLVLTTYDTDADVLPAIEAGATAYLLKDAPRDELLRAIRAACRGESVLSPTVAGRLMGNIRNPAQAALSDRELDVLNSSRTAQRAKRRPASSSSARRRSRRICWHVYDMLGVRDRAAAVGEAHRRGLLS